MENSREPLNQEIEDIWFQNNKDDDVPKIRIIQGRESLKRGKSTQNT